MRQAHVAVPADLRLRPNEYLVRIALAGLVDALIDQKPVIGLAGVQDKAGKVVLVLWSVAEPLRDEVIGGAPERGRAPGQPVVIFQLQAIERRRGPAQRQVRAPDFGSCRVEDGGRKNQSEDLGQVRRSRRAYRARQ